LFRGLLGLPLGQALSQLAYALILGAVVMTMTTPRFEFGTIHINAGDVAAAAASLCWLMSWVLSPSTSLNLRGVLWPAVIVMAAGVSAFSSVDVRATGIGLVELVALWVLPAVTVPNIVRTESRESQLLSSIAIGSLVAGVVNLFRAFQLGLSSGGLPQVWGAAQYFQGYFQVIGLTVAASRVHSAVVANRWPAAFLWGAACAVNTGALLLTQTRGAWLAGLVALLFLGILWRPSALVAGLGVLSVGAVVLAGADWASTIRERVQSTFTLEAGISGFESSLGRLALMVTAWQMFLAHPLMGVGLKNFPIAMTLYAPPGMPLAYQMGPDQVLTPVEGPHSTYLSLLSEVGLLGFVGLVCWEVAAILRAYRESRHRVSSWSVSSTNAAILLASLAVVTVYNCFFEMNQSGTLVFIALLAVAYRTRQPQPNGRQSP